MEDVGCIRDEVFQKEFSQDILLKPKAINQVSGGRNQIVFRLDDSDKKDWQCIKYLQQQIWLTSLPKIFDILASITIEASKSNKDSRSIQNLVDRGTKTQFYDLFKMKSSELEENKEAMNNYDDGVSESDISDLTSVRSISIA